MSKVTVAGIQITGQEDINKNLVHVVDKVRHAYNKGAQLVVLPEACNIVQKDKVALTQSLNSEKNNVFLQTLQNLAKELKLWLHLGSMLLRSPGPKFFNRAFLISPEGIIVSIYDKIHMFDVTLSNEEVYKESNSYQAGSNTVVHGAPFGNYGLSICYDVRFPHLYTKLAQKGAEIIAIPACFTYTTGKAHWEILCRARAIETGCFVLAIGQTGKHPDGRRTFGHSMIIDPWGQVLSSLGEEPGIVLATLDTNLVREARSRVPAIHSIKHFT